MHRHTRHILGQNHQRRSIGLAVTAVLAAASLAACGGSSDSSSASEGGPGSGQTIQGCTSTGISGLFHNLIPALGLEELGYKVEGPTTLSVPAEHQATASGQCAYTIDEWVPLHDSTYEKVKDQTERVGPVIADATQGYYIDKATADKYGITDFSQLSDPDLAKLFAADGGDQANLTGAEPGWGSEAVINHELESLGLQDTVHQDQGQYFTMFADTLSRYKEGKPVLFYTWTPNWTLTELQPGKDVTELKVAADDCLPEQPCGDSTTGFPNNDIYALVNKDWAAENPAAAKFLSLVKIPIEDVNAENLLIEQGEDTSQDVETHAKKWIADHQAEWDQWIKEAKDAASSN